MKTHKMIIVAQRDMTVELSLQYELTPFPLSLFSNKENEQAKQGRVYKDKPEGVS
jgi:hypothetical protein